VIRRADVMAAQMVIEMVDKMEQQMVD